MISDNDTLGRVHRAGKKLDFAGGGNQPRGLVGHRPETAIQALMEAPPHADPERAVDDDPEQDEAPYDWEGSLILGGLTDLDIKVVTLVFVEGYSLREAEAALGVSKSELHRMTQRLKPRLAELLQPMLERKYPQ